MGSIRIYGERDLLYHGVEDIEAKKWQKSDRHNALAFHAGGVRPNSWLLCRSSMADSGYSVHLGALCDNQHICHHVQQKAWLKLESQAHVGVRLNQ